MEIDKCRNADYCADDKAIEEFVYDKIFDIQYLDNNPNFNSFEDFVNKAQGYIGSFPLTFGRFTDLGFSFRKNSYIHKDNWLYGSEEESIFYNIKKDYLDTFNIPSRM